MTTELLVEFIFIKTLFQLVFVYVSTLIFENKNQSQQIGRSERINYLFDMEFLKEMVRYKYNFIELSSFSLKIFQVINKVRILGIVLRVTTFVMSLFTFVI